MRAGRRDSLLIVVAVCLCSGLLLLLADTALRKSFWVDEGFEIALVCERPVGRMLVEGSFGCSPAPLFSAIERLVVRRVEPLGLPMRLTYRAVSLAAATIALLALLFGLQHRLGFKAALAAFATLAADQGFHHYAEQNRAYVFWLMSTVLLVIVTIEASLRDGMRLRNRLALLVGAGLVSAMSATPGCGQATLAFAAFWAIRRWLSPGGALGRKATAALAGAAVALVALDVHYWVGSWCRGWDGAKSLGLDLDAASDRWAVVANAISPLWPPGWGPLEIAGHALLLAGFLGPIAWWRRRQALDPAERQALAIWTACVAQLSIALPVAASLAASKYLFLPRMFIFVLAPRAILCALGFWIAVRALTRAVEGGRPALVRGVAWAAAAALTAGSLWRAETISRPWRFPFPPTGDVACAALNVPELHIHRPQGSPDEFNLNFLVRLGRAYDACASAPSVTVPPRHLLALDATNQPDWFRVVDEAPAGFEPLQVCGEPVTLRHGRFRD